MSPESVQGTRGEDRESYTREESRAIRRRSLRLLGSILRPFKKLIALTVTVVEMCIRDSAKGYPAARRVESARHRVAEQFDDLNTLTMLCLLYTSRCV